MPRVKVSESLFAPLGGQQTQFRPASDQPVVLQNTHRMDALPGVIWRKGLMKAEYSLDLRLMKRKDMYKGEEARVLSRPRQRVTSRGGGGSPLLSVSLLQWVPQTQTRLFISRFGDAGSAVKDQWKKPFPAKFVLYLGVFQWERRVCSETAFTAKSPIFVQPILDHPSLCKIR